MESEHKQEKMVDKHNKTRVIQHLTEDRATSIQVEGPVEFADKVLKNDDQDLQNFIRHLVPIFEDANPEEIQPEAKFREIKGYSSLTAFLIMGLITEAYGVDFTGVELRKSNTILDIFSIIRLK